MGNQIAQCKPFLEAMDADDMDTFKQLCEKEESVYWTVHLEAIKNGKIEFVKYLMSPLNPETGKFFYECAIMNNREEVVKLFLSWSWPLTKDALTRTINYANVEIVEMIFESKPEHLSYTHLPQILEFYRDEVDCTDLIVSLVLELERRKMPMFGVDDLIEEACMYNRSRLAMFLHDHHFPFHNNIYESCIYDIELFIFFYEKVMGDKPISRIPDVVIFSCDVDYYKYLVGKGVSLNDDRLDLTLQSSHIDVVKYLHESGHKWDPTYPLGNVIFEDVRRYCHDNEIPRKTPHGPLCVYCKQRKLEMLREYWELENEEYDSLIQWPPREVIDDLVELLEYEDGIEAENLVEEEYVVEEGEYIVEGEGEYDFEEEYVTHEEHLEEVYDDQAYDDEDEYTEDGYTIRGYSMEDFMVQRGLSLRRD